MNLSLSCKKHRKQLKNFFVRPVKGAFNGVKYLGKRTLGGVKKVKNVITFNKFTDTKKAKKANKEAGKKVSKAGKDTK